VDLDPCVTSANRCDIKGWLLVSKGPKTGRS
jgi:hypothetical protein